MRIAFDHQAFCLQKTGGISRYFYHLIEQLSTLNQTVKAFAPVYRNQYARQLPRDVVAGRYVKDYPRYCADAVVALNGAITRARVSAWQPDIVHETYFSSRSSGTKAQPNVLTVFDMISECGLVGAEITADKLKQSNKYAAVGRADHVICISEHTRQDLIRLYNVAPEKTSTIHLGCEVIAADTAPQSQISNADQRPYLLFVGLRSGYKNFARFVEAVASSAQLQTSFDIVAFGGGGFSSAEQALLRELNFRPKQVRQVEGDDVALARHYAQANALVYPSCYEGFGLPPLEAMAYRCPVVSSHSSALPEIIGNAAEFFDPNDTSSIAQAIQNVVMSPAYAQALIEKGLARVGQFTWQQCAQKHLALYQSLGDRSHTGVAVTGR
jgi:glycosyltransferase involved in cell wall biosynthesis